MKHDQCDFFFSLLLNYALDFEYILHFFIKIEKKYYYFYVLADLHILLTRFSILLAHFLQFTDLKDDVIIQKDNVIIT